MVAVSYARRADLSELPDDVQQCLAYWESLRAGTFAPPWSAFDWSRMPPSVIPQVGVVDVRDAPRDFIYRFWGTAHVRLHGQEMTGKSVTAMRPVEESRSVFRQYAETLEAREPLLFENRIESPGGGLPMKEVSLRLLFSDDGRTVSQLMAVSDVRKDFEGVQEAFKG